jgi:uncharacterized surface protein with fasciclin (FAS1) repeats
MKSRYIQLLLCSLVLLFAASCTKNEKANVNPPGTSLFETLMAKKELSLYRAALQRAGMLNAATFADGGPFTVFAPVDSAFINAGLTLESINNYDPEKLALIFKYSMLYGRISSSTLIGFYSQDMINRHPSLKPRLNKNYYGIFFNGIPLVSGGSSTLPDGVLHELPRVPFPQNGNLLEMIRQQPDLTFFAAVLDRTGYAINLTQDDGSGIYVFAPDNDAYKKLGYASIDAINQADINVLSKPLQDMARLFTADLIGGFSFNYDLFYAGLDGFTLFSTGNITPTHIIKPDILGTNGVLHVVDQVIFVVPR